MPLPVRILLLADTHMGLHLPLKSRTQRRRRGLDFLANMRGALEPALDGQADLVVHGGDLLDRGRVPTAVLEMALEPLLEVAQAGVPVFLVPGNHERARIPLHLWTAHPNLHVFHEPCTFVLEVRDCRVALSGFPFDRQARSTFAQRVAEAQRNVVRLDAQGPSDGGTTNLLCLLCVHQTFEGAQVGPRNYTFRSGADVVRGRDVPAAFAAVLSGHIHRRQVLTHDLSGRPMAAPVLYPGSVERTAFAERNEPKGYLVLEVEEGEDQTRSARRTEVEGDTLDRCGPQPHPVGEALRALNTAPVFDLRGLGGSFPWLLRAEFRELPARPMLTVVLQTEGRSASVLGRELRRRLDALPPDAVVRIILRGPPTPEALSVLSAARLREWAPASMNVSVAGSVFRGGGVTRAPRRHKAGIDVESSHRQRVGPKADC